MLIEAITIFTPKDDDYDEISEEILSYLDSIEYPKVNRIRWVQNGAYSPMAIVAGGIQLIGVELQGEVSDADVKDISKITSHIAVWHKTSQIVYVNGRRKPV